MRKWRMQEAKAKFAEVVKRAAAEGPQIVTYRAVDVAAVLSIGEDRRIDPKLPSFVEHLLNGPKLDDETVEIINDRSRDLGRDIAHVCIPFLNPWIS